MAGPRHLQDPLAHDEKFKALKEEVDEGLEEALSSMFIPGMTISFSGTFGGSDGKRPINPHTGKANEEFALCDGGTYQASKSSPMITTPDLQGRFVLAADETRPPGAIGGVETPTVTVHPHTLTVAQMPSHKHGRNLYVLSMGSDKTGDVDWGLEKERLHRNATMSYRNDLLDAQGDSQPHAHGASIESTLPPYYALAYIMKL